METGRAQARQPSQFPLLRGDHPRGHPFRWSVHYKDRRCDV